MKILYGVQGTGNGHLSRARAMAAAFAHSGIEVDYLFSGRAAGAYFDMGVFGRFEIRQGLSFVNVDGAVDYLRTVIGNRYLQFLRDVHALDLTSYDLVISDFEPVSAWAGRLRGKTVISVGHQPAFDYPIPLACRDRRSEWVMRMFAPGNVRIGMHWARFNAPILPPMLALDAGTEAGYDATDHDDKILVYLPFASQERVQRMLTELADYQFYVYAPGSPFCDRGNLHLRPLSLTGFRQDLHACSAVLCGAGFELASECLALGKRLLVKPQRRQMEQASNALALSQLGYAQTLDELSVPALSNWLRSRLPAPKIEFPDVAAALVDWLEAADFAPEAVSRLSDALWREVRVVSPAQRVAQIAVPSALRAGCPVTV